ncbi:MAG: DNA-binding protein YbiB [Aquabacterium sp.]|uniref:DNA-binding protein YbiB n=1 Tax=Aquabacterium sp. TaxID=1872578 RepID=UPI0025BEE8B9|nr:DNA-binding protein YbiB [Aquabacterium sp.]MBI5927412.1 DNA-binding protein YbiB [Aquabacterium sp.]
MSIAAYIKVIGRGKEGARSLGVGESRDLFEQVLDHKVTDLEIGAFCLAMRIKGESTEELDGFVQASHARCLDLSAAAAAAPKGIVVLPSYNGARKLPNLTALLATELARQGLGVLVHGPARDPGRVTTAQVFEAAGMPLVNNADALAAAWRSGQAAFMNMADLCPPMDKLLAVRWTIGLRTPAHSVAKLLDPFAARPPSGVKSIRVVNHTHPEYAIAMAAFLQHVQANAMLMRGTEGEPVADARRQPKCDVFLSGTRVDELCLAPEEGVLTSLPELPASHSAADTANYIAAILSGQQAMPSAIQAQANALVQALARIAAPAAGMGAGLPA